MKTRTDRQLRVQIPEEIWREIGLKPNQELDIRLIKMEKTWVIFLREVKG